MSHLDDFRHIRDLIADAVDKGADKEEAVWTVVEGVTALIDGVTDSNIAGTTVGALQSLRSGVGLLEGIEVIPNPYFVWNGHADDDASMTYTRKYLRNRAIKGFAGGLFGLAGTASSQVTQVDAAGIAMHANALGSTSLHLIKLKAIGAGYKQSRTLTQWIDLIIKMKAVKATVRGSQLAGAAIPVGAVGAVTGIVAAAVKLGVKLSHTKVCAVTAAEIHWRAFQEQALSGGLFGKTGKIGPASNMMYEVFTRRAATRIFGKYDVDRIISEPTGWMCLNDKLMLI
ncbi:MAG: hypothetical protein H6842_01800 [Rhodospirillaceae bacterium]|nr:hypothetical protein [Rhodospirillaceae bacterium]